MAAALMRAVPLIGFAQRNNATQTLLLRFVGDNGESFLDTETDSHIHTTLSSGITLGHAARYASNVRVSTCPSPRSGTAADGSGLVPVVRQKAMHFTSSCIVEVQMAASAALPPLPQQQSQQQPATRRAGIRRIAVFDGVAMVHKPAGLCTHPYREPQRKHSTDPLVCPACGRVYGSDEAWAWHSMHDHLTNSQDATHVEWRAAHPQGLVCEFTAEFTLWHALHDWPGLFDDQAPDEPDGSPSASPSN